MKRNPTPSLFDDQPSAADSASELITIVQTRADTPLTPEQKLFNTLTKKLVARRETLQQWEQAREVVLQRSSAELEPLLQQLTVQKRAMAVQLDAALDAVFHKPGLTKTERSLTAQIICSLTQNLLEDIQDEDVKALYNKYSGSDFDAEAEASVAGFKEMLSDQFGIDMSDAQGGSLEDILAHAAQAIKRDTEQQTAKRDARKERKKTPKQRAKEEAQKAQEDASNLSIREVYRRLASALHPDRESDAALREQKTALMARVNQAYDQKDLLQLLELQLELAHIDSSSLSNLSSQRLNDFNQILKAQVLAAEQEIASIQAPLRAHYRLNPYVKLRPTHAIDLLREDIDAAKQEMDGLTQDLVIVAEPKSLKAWLKKQKQEIKRMQREMADDALDDFGDEELYF